jgi:nitroimidazol reductase NimA-like FMN-containing flavoprotein (pyridoxamine 5'-phosphate oxidase superfamily)
LVAVSTANRANDEDMRRREKQIESRAEVDAIIAGSDVCRLALAVDNAPYLVPLSFGYDGDAIYLHTARKGKKIDYFEANNRVCFEFERNVRFVQKGGDACDATFSFESVVGYGTIGELTDFDQKSHALSQITCQYTGPQTVFDRNEVAKVRVWKISIDSVEGKRSPGPE